MSQSDQNPDSQAKIMRPPIFQMYKINLEYALGILKFIMYLESLKRFSVQNPREGGRAGSKFQSIDIESIEQELAMANEK